MAAAGGKRKVTLYFSRPLLEETQRESLRQDRSISWIIQAAWRHAREEIRRLPSSVAASQAHASVAPPAPPVPASLIPPPRARITSGRRASLS